ncbi:hypothetical protein SBRCBS47491_005139 [Sporothrix bragantina]|uniref:Uncharacterized protein n=1 Tax=Sporothrix bragantina TaxID=671064 RepID=A0ABP0BW61_9PEZI
MIASLIASLSNGGAIGLFSGLNLLALILVFLPIEETKRRSLEDLDLVFAVPKRTFVRFQVQTTGRHVVDLDMEPSLYIDATRGPIAPEVVVPDYNNNIVALGSYSSPPTRLTALAEAYTAGYMPTGRPRASLIPGNTSTYPGTTEYLRGAGEEYGGPVDRRAMPADNGSGCSSIHD